MQRRFAAPNRYFRHRTHPHLPGRYPVDAYRDSAGRTHVVYLRRGASAGGEEQLWHAVIEGGALVHHARIDIPDGHGGVMTEDTTGRLYLISYAMDSEPDDALRV